MASTAKTATSILLDRPCIAGFPTADYFRIVESPEPVLSADDAGSVLIQTLAASADPYLRGRIKTMAAGAAMEVFQAGRVIASNAPGFVAGDLWGGLLPLVTSQVVPAAAVAGGAIWRLTGLLDEEHISHGVGILGMPGATAYGGLTGVLRPAKGETIFISAASGAVGGLVGQIAKKHFGCRVVGSAGGPAKCAFVTGTLGFDACVDYKSAPDAAALGGLLKGAAPEGIDMYFENVGGMHFDAAFAALRPYGRVAVCGTISSYNDEVQPRAGVNLSSMIYTFQRIEGFVCSPWMRGEKRADFLRDMSRWMREDGGLVAQETFFEGIAAWPEAFMSLFTGANLGKVVVRMGK